MKKDFTNNDITFVIGRERYSDAVKILSIRTKNEQDLASEIDGVLNHDYFVCNGHEAYEIAQTILNDFRHYALEEDKVPTADNITF